MVLEIANQEVVVRTVTFQFYSHAVQRISEPGPLCLHVMSLLITVVRVLDNDELGLRADPGVVGQL